MALARTNVGSFTSATEFGANFTTGAFTPGDNSLLVVCAHASSDNDTIADSLTISGGSLTWTKRVTAEATRTGLDLSVREVIWTAPVTTGASMTLTLGQGGNTIYQWKVGVEYYTGYDTGSPIGGTATGGGDIPTSTYTPATMTLSATPAASSYIVAALGTFVEASGYDLNVGSGWTLGNENVADDDFTGLITQYRTSYTSTSVVFGSQVTNGAQDFGSYAEVALELKAASAGSILPQMMQYYYGD